MNDDVSRETRPVDAHLTDPANARTIGRDGPGAATPEPPLHPLASPYPKEGHMDPTDAAQRIALALSILAHRPWCGADVWHAQEVEQALQGGSIDEILGGRG